MISLNRLHHNSPQECGDFPPLLGEENRPLNRRLIELSFPVSGNESRSFVS